MKIRGHLITSLASFRKYFEFHSVWNQLNIFLRDMAPKNIPYLNDNKVDKTAELIYYAIQDPSKVKIDNNSLVISVIDEDFPIPITNDISSLDSLMDYEHEDKIRIFLLYELANKKITDKCLSQEKNTSDDHRQITLCDGSSINIVDLDYSGSTLHLRPIFVDVHSSCPSIVDGYELAPGRLAFGVFSHRGFHKILPPVAQNTRYLIRLLGNPSAFEIEVKDKLVGTKVHLKGVTSFCTINDDNFAYILNDMVYCAHNDVLARKLRFEVGLFKTPLFINVDKQQLSIIMNDGEVVKIQL